MDKGLAEDQHAAGRLRHAVRDERLGRRPLDRRRAACARSTSTTSRISPRTCGIRSRARSTTSGRSSRSRTPCGRTGIFWRNDKLRTSIPRAWQTPTTSSGTARRRTRPHLLANAQDVLAMPMFRDGLTDVNVTDPALITEGEGRRSPRSRDGRRAAVRPRATTRTSRRARPISTSRGRATSATRWSSCPTCDRRRSSPTTGRARTGIPRNVDNDTIVLLNSGKNPVLAHLLANYILDTEQRDGELHQH